MKTLVLLVLVLVSLSLLRSRLFRVEQASGSAADGSRSPSASGTVQLHYSPQADLDALDIREIANARSSIDIAMYSFIDRRIADVLIHTHSSVQIRLYRDGEQFETEQHHATFSEPSTTQMFAGHSRIHIRIKQDDRRDLMHSKAFAIDGVKLRDGSANWSKSALLFQDNSWFLIRDRHNVSTFLEDFEQMWARPSNHIVQ